MRAKTEYDLKAEAFLKKHGLSIEAVRAVPNECPPFDPEKCGKGEHIHGDKFWITIERHIPPSEITTLEFPFWDSLQDKQKRDAGHPYGAKRKPTAYDVLSCISNETECPLTFEEFCNEFGYDEDSRRAYATFERVREFALRAQRFFTEEERGDLWQIN